MLELHRIRPSIIYPSFLLERVISTMIIHCHIFRGKGCPGVPVPANLILALFIRMGHTLVVQPLKSMFSKRRWASHGRAISLIDIIYQVDAGVGMVSQSAQWAVSGRKQITNIPNADQMTSHSMRIIPGPRPWGQHTL